MNISLESVYLYTQKMDLMCRFVTQVFDLELTHLEDESYFYIGDLRIVFRESTSRPKSKELFNFNVDNVDMLHDMQQKFEFFNYRDTIKTKKKKPLSSISETETHKILELSDPDGNIWSLTHNYMDAPNARPAGSLGVPEYVRNY